MTTTIEDRRRVLLADLVNRSDLEPRVDARFADHDYRHVLTPELLQRHPEDLLGIITSHLELAGRRRPGDILVRAFKPEVSSHGWGTGSTIVQVVVDDSPYIVDSIIAELDRQGRTIRLLAHPQLDVARNQDGELLALSDGLIAESWVHVELPPAAGSAVLGQISARLESVLSDVAAAVNDGPAMVQRVLELAEEIEAADVAGSADEKRHARELLEWLTQDNFLFLGYRPDSGGSNSEVVAGPRSGLGLLATPRARARFDMAPDERLLILSKSSHRSTVHRDAPLDEITVSARDDESDTVVNHRIVGLYTSKAYNASIESIPFLTDKVADIQQRSGYAPDSHAAKDLLSVLATYPRDELLQADAEFLTRVATTVVASLQHGQLLLFGRPDTSGRSISHVVYVPRDRYDSQLRQRIETILVAAYGDVEVDHTVRLGETPLAIAQFVVRAASGQRLPAVDLDDLESWLRTAARSWDEDWSEAMVAEFGEQDAAQLIERWGTGLDEAYRASHTPRLAAADIRQLEHLSPGKVEAHLYQEQGAAASDRRLRLYTDRPIGLTEVLPILLDFGVKVVDERVHRVAPSNDLVRYLLDFGLSAQDAGFWGEPGEPSGVLPAFIAIWEGRCEADGFNELIGAAGLTWPQVVILRMVAAYLKQTTPYSRQHIQSALVQQPAIAANLVELFEARFVPGLPDETRLTSAAKATAAVMAGLADVPSLDHDRIIRCFLDVIEAGLRTSFYQQGRGTEPPAVIAYKLDPREVAHLPVPRPEFEIWAYGPSVEGVHLRFGKIARGGLRWSNRREDFRTEVLGLVKAQIVKNAVIVPTGAKGCFFPKQLPDPQVDRAGWAAAGRRAYQEFVAAMLDVTDNLVGHQVVHPDRVVRYDEDDTYLVVAADKGTAAFSDVANRIAHERGFWLDDAFASGGSTGYDHKQMGITARGAWRSVIRHFSEIDIDPGRDEITAVGIGDMSGDVFGNGMLCSRVIKLVAAFDHRHVFIDPNPDPETAYLERERLFGLPTSSWVDYSSELVSAGGGVFPRSAKSIQVSPQMRELLPALGEAEAVSPTELIRAILQAPVDLLWNGGIGTYVKASSESNGEVGDPANDAVRVDGAQLRCTVVGEGGNLGLSQLGRIEVAQHGVRINTDAIDNSGGVASSDYEVNIKILLNQVVERGEMTMQQRNELLRSMTDEVADRVLRINYEQNVLLGNARYLSEAMLPSQERLMQALEARGCLDRELEGLPDAEGLRRRERDGRGLTSPEFAVLVAYAKIALTEDILASELPDDPWFEGVLVDYFPAALASMADAIKRHPLRRQIIATQLANRVVNRGGITFVNRAMEETGAATVDIVRAFTVWSELLGMRSYLAEVEALDGTVKTGVQSDLYLSFRRLTDRGVRNLLGRVQPLADVQTEITRYVEPVEDVLGALDRVLAPEGLSRYAARADALVTDGVPRELARRAAGLLYSTDTIGIVDLARGEELAAEQVAEMYFRLAEELHLEEVQALLAEAPRDGRWDSAAKSSLRQDLYRLTGALTAQVLQAEGGHVDAQVGNWSAAHSERLGGFKSLVQQLHDEESLGLGQVWVLVRDVQRLVTAT